MAEGGLVIQPVIVLGLLLGLYELILIHRDEDFRGSHWIGHGIHAVVFMMVALFAVFNWEYFLQVTGLAAKGIPLISDVLVGRIAIGVILNFKMHAVSAVIKGKAFAGGVSGGMAEHWTHTILVTVLVVVAPYYWPLLAPFLPGWVGL
ncbi:MAG: hypothetical protein CMH64_01580 [Nanoarchaeota archaeon]|nr:hypothetical protein [Nanoarchaeota archaeon]|tara:strand:+ start:4292 stop:4735 length:444 start_codon:yes stop_codon:yes gene_type:complete